MTSIPVISNLLDLLLDANETAGAVAAVRDADNDSLRAVLSQLSLLPDESAALHAILNLTAFLIDSRDDPASGTQHRHGQAVLTRGAAARCIAADHADTALTALIAAIAPHTLFRDQLDAIRHCLENTILNANQGLSSRQDIQPRATLYAGIAATECAAAADRIEATPALRALLTRHISHALTALLAMAENATPPA